MMQQHPKPRMKVYSIEKAAQIRGVDVRHIEAEIKRGMLRTIKRRGQILITQDELDRYFDQGSGGQQTFGW